MWRSSWTHIWTYANIKTSPFLSLLETAKFSSLILLAQKSFQTPLSLIYIHSQAGVWEGITYVSCNKTFQGKCGYYAEAKTEAAERCQVVVCAVVLKYVSWKMNIRWERRIQKIEKKIRGM